MMHPLVLAVGKVDIGSHITTKIAGMTVDVDVVAATLISGAILLGLGFYARAKASSGVPGKIQLVFETVVAAVEDLVDSAIGPAGKPIVPLAVTLFLFILIANWLEVIPTGYPKELLGAPTGDVNLPYAMAIFVIVLVHVASVRARGLKGYAGHYFKPFKVLLPINVIEEITKPITLSLRLFGNMFAGGLMVALIGLLPVYVVPGGDIIWKLFDMFIGFIQAFIFALLTVVYFGIAMDTESH